jgi:hypothetical protein
MPLLETTLTIKGLTFKSGVPVKFRYMRYGGETPYLGSRFDQDIKPTGKYLLLDDSRAYEYPVFDWEYGIIELKCPLVIEFIATRGPNGWKQRLSEHFKGSVKKRLTNKLIRKGYDAVITIDSEKEEVKEIVIF